MSKIPALMGGRALEHDAAFESGFGLKTKAGEKLLTVDSSDRTMVVADQARIKGFNALSPRFELKWIAGLEGLVALNSTAHSDLIDPRFEILGTNASNDDVTFYAEGGLKFETDGAADDQVILLPHLDAGQSVWTEVTWGTDKEVIWECHMKTGSSVDATVLWAGLKKTNTDTVATDPDQVFFRYEDDVASGKWLFVSSVADVDTQTDTGVTGAADQELHFRIVIAADRTAKAYLNGALVHTTGALTDAVDLIPYIGIDNNGSAGAKHMYVFGQAISRKVG